MHHPVLLNEAIEGLKVKKEGLYIDATVGEGGHMREIIKRGGKVLGIEWDEEQILKIEDRSKIVKGNFADIEAIARKQHFFPVDGILFDLGLSLGQIKNSGRGFSYENLNEPLDMRIDSSTQTTAQTIVNSLSEEQLYEILARYGEEIHSRSIVQTLVRSRTIKPIITVGDLISIIDRTIGKKNTKTYARIFQALRIAVNNELDNLKKGLNGALNIIKKEGRIVILAFHSVEDRLIKRFVKSRKLRSIKKGVGSRISPLRYERSAILRVIVNDIKL